MRLRGETVYPLADRLRVLGLAFVPVTGIDSEDLPPRHAGAPFCTKPLDINVVPAPEK